MDRNRAGTEFFDFQKKKFRRFLKDPDNPQSLPHNGINAILEDGQHRIWIGTRGGLSLMNEGVFENFFHDPRDQSTVSSNIITSILEDKDGKLWVGTFDGGLNKLDIESKKFAPLPQSRR